MVGRVPINHTAGSPAPDRRTEQSDAGSPASALPARITRIASAIAGSEIRAGGIDLVDLARLSRAVRRSGTPLIQRVLLPAEQELVDAADGAAFGALFGIKESVIKAVGGLPRGSGFHDIEVTAVPHPGSDPVGVELHGVLHGWARRRRVRLWAACEQLTASLYLTWAVAVDGETAARPQALAIRAAR